MSKATHLDLPFRFGTVGTPMSAPKNGGSAGGVQRIREMNLSTLELAWVRGTTHIGDEERLRRACLFFDDLLVGLARSGATPRPAR